MFLRLVFLTALMFSLQTQTMGRRKMKSSLRFRKVSKDLREIKSGVKALMDEILILEGNVFYIALVSHHTYTFQCLGMVTSGFEFVENGTTLVQDQSYNHETKEAVLKVPAHKDYANNTFIMVSKSANSPLAGKMMSVQGDICELHDKPDGVDAEHLAKGKY